MYKKLIITAIVLFFAATAHADIWTSCQGRWDLANLSFTDLSGNGNTLTAYNTPTAAAGFSAGTNASTSFDCSSGEYLMKSDNASLSFTGNFTISCWIYVTWGSKYNMIVNKLLNSGQYSYCLYVDDSNKLALNVSANGTSYQTAVSSSTIAANTWTHVACVYDGEYVRLYINGVQNGTPLAKTDGIKDGTDAFTVGYHSTPNFGMNGRIDDLAVWSRALSADEVFQMKYAYLDNFVEKPKIQGALKDSSGAAIDCSTYNVRMNVYQLNNTASAPIFSLLNTAADGTFSIYVPTTNPYLITYEYGSVYTPLGQTNIAGAEIMVGE